MSWQWNQGVFGGRVYTVPQASGPMGLFCRADLFAKWGIDVPTTWTEFEQAARVVKARAEGVRMCAFAPTRPAWCAAMCRQRGARWVRTEGGSWIIDMDDRHLLEVDPRQHPVRGRARRARDAARRRGGVRARRLPLPRT
ncbi:extracellular solute-binding protein [Streptomyces sp. MK7]|uniref:extracellular solute-binding protein n=1 Tax=Streptomyces sp. MK7 TaxID=3067635 RepID=UPI00292CCF92|nr:extracellular solute-binding protein [Streptomyces sp. MK7]